MTHESQLALAIQNYRINPSAFVADMWGMSPQPCKPEFQEKYKDCLIRGAYDEVKYFWFEPFVRGQHTTWHQNLILHAVGRAMRDEAPRRIAVRSGHGTSKSCTMSLLILWFLACHVDSRVACTSPSSDQLYDILWSEIKKWIDKMPQAWGNLYEWQSSYIRMRESVETWFCRARTSRKDSPEALAGIHAENVFLAVDEASGVPEEIYNVAEGSLTEKNTLVILISNPTRLSGYFYECFHKDKENWQTMRLNSHESPVVDDSFNKRIQSKHGLDSDEYRIRVLGEFPNAESIDEQGYVPLFDMNKVVQTSDNDFVAGKKTMGIDPAGAGKDKTVWVIRDAHKAKVVGVEKTSSVASIVQKTLTLMEFYQIKGEDIFMDSFGTNQLIIQDLARLGVYLRPYNAGDKLDRKVDGDEEADRFLNKRAQCYWRLRDWLVQGNEVVRHACWEDEIPGIRYRRTLAGSIQIMPKVDMKKKGYHSPDHLDSLCSTFCEEWIDQSIDDYNDSGDETSEIDGGSFG